MQQATDLGGRNLTEAPNMKEFQRVREAVEISVYSVRILRRWIREHCGPPSDDPVTLLSQLLGHLRESRAIAQDKDVVVGPYWRSAHGSLDANLVKAEAIILEHRNGLLERFIPDGSLKRRLFAMNEGTPGPQTCSRIRETCEER